MANHKNILVFGSRKKADYLLYISYVLTKLQKKILINDFTEKAIYKNGYTRVKNDDQLFDYQGIDILLDAGTVSKVKSILNSNSEYLENYDVVFYDVDNLETLRRITEQTKFNEVIYIGDFERDHLILDAEMITYFYEKYPEERLRRFTFGSKYKINSNTLETFIQKPVKWNSVHLLFEADESMEELRLEMQHQMTIPFSHVNRTHQEYIVGFVSELFILHTDEIYEAIKGKKGVFSNILKKKKAKAAHGKEKIVLNSSNQFEDLLLDKSK